MSKYFARQYFPFNAFRRGENPTVRADAYEKFSTLSELQKNRELETSGRYAADLMTICENNSVQGLMMQIFDMHNKSSTLFTLDVKDGIIDWDALHAMTEMHMHGTLQQSHIDMSNVGVTQIHYPNNFVQAIAAKVCERAGLSASEGFRFQAEAARCFDESKADTEAQRIQEALQQASRTLHKNISQDIAIAYMEVASQLSRPGDIMSWQCAQLSNRRSLELREAWTGNFAEMQQQPGILPNQALWLGGLKAVEPIIAGLTEQIQEIPVCTKEDEVTFGFLRAELIDAAEKAGCSREDIANSLNFAIQIHAAHYRPQPDSMIAAAFNRIIRNTIKESDVPFNGVWNLYSNVSNPIEKHLTHDPHISPAQDFRMALMAATPEIEKMMRDVYGVKEPRVPDMNAVYAEMDKMRACTLWTRYAEHALAELPRDQASEFLRLYQHNITMANVTSDITHTGTLALQMYKTVHDWTSTHTVPMGQQMAMAGIKNDAFSDALENGITAEQLYAAEDREEHGDDDIGDDTF